LVCEISEVMGETAQEAELQVDQALKTRKEEVKEVAKPGDREAQRAKAQSG
jgi:hypothetical protein